MFSLHTKGQIYQGCVRSVVLNGSETWAAKQEDLAKLDRNDMIMVQWIGNVTLKDRMASDEPGVGKHKKLYTKW